MLKVVEEMRSFAPLGIGRDQFNKALDEIEREIAERYMLLPVDANGVPIHVGDYIKGEEELDPIVKVTGVAQNEFHGPMVQTDDAITGRWYCVVPGTVHVKPRTIEDVLIDFAEEVRGCCDTSETVGKYVAEIRELLGGAE